jgi:hypothetical protein
MRAYRRVVSQYIDMNNLYNAPPSTVSYIVRISEEEPEEILTAAVASKRVADNLRVGYSAKVMFKNAIDLELVRANFNKRKNEPLDGR